MTLSVEGFARPISDAARIVRAMIPRHSLDLEDLVQVGWEKTLRYLAGQESVSAPLVFVSAKLAMLNAHARWMQKAPIKNASGNFVRAGASPRLTEFSEITEWQCLIPPPPVETLIDIKRALEACSPAECAAWSLTRWEQATVKEASAAIGCGPYTVIARARRADTKIAQAIGAEPVCRHGRTPVRSRKRDEWRRRYRELRSLGVAPAAANRAANSRHGYATALRMVQSS